VRIVLASASPRRSELLASAGFSFDVLPTDVDESVRPGERPADYVRRLAVEKSARALEMTASAVDEIIVAADTTVVVDEEILGKPVDDADAARMLRLLSGRSHLVLTGVSVRSRGVQLDGVDETRVFVQPLTHHDVEWYVGSGEGRDKAGGYAIQGLASRFIPRIEGSYSNVVGLPVALVDQLLRKVSAAAGSG
jgi:septum formation protein